ncbi:hypothetical protein [Pedobacter sp. SYP-B3415]|uniref:hypothetical protein n=1 Tax=Pedobacter sp. SYP-B3415 TaxID=2496641 RepID=UPI00101BC02D|nr:hypothetical protein [Pedobacter sp. SYP-B3415]
MSQIKIPTPEKMQKYPWATTAVVLFSVCVFLTFKLLQKPVGCETEVKVWRDLYLQEKGNSDKLRDAIYVKNGVIYQQEVEKKKLDSTIRQKLGEKAKRIVEGKEN